MVDDYIPCNKYGRPAFCRARGNQLAVLGVVLIQKAWAKVHGSYAETEGGLIESGFNGLTGAPTYAVEIKKEN
jgi:hypothetical protein